jgi:hypothetical protein
MQSGIGVHRLLLIFTLLALPFVVGSSCAFFFSSGGGSGGKVIVKDDDDDDDEEITPQSAQVGNFDNPTTAGINYTSDSVSGITEGNGQFRYIEGESVRFFIGDIALGAPVKGKPVISPKDLVATDSDGAAAARNISRLLSALDADRADEVVTIPTAVRRAAVRSNASVSDAIEFLDFSDEVAFANAASQLVAVLTDDYPHTATLTDADSAEDGEPAAPTSDQAP